MHATRYTGWAPRIIGRDDRSCEVWMRRWRCVTGHWYDLETPAPDRDE